MIEDFYIVFFFDCDFEGIQVYIMKMGGLVEEVIFDVSQVLIKCDEELFEKVCECDVVIDVFEELINDEVVCVIVLCLLIVIDLCLILLVIKIFGNFECIGDYVKNFVKWNVVFVYLFLVEGFCCVFGCMVKEVQLMLKDVLDVYI